MIRKLLALLLVIAAIGAALYFGYRDGLEHS